MKTKLEPYLCYLAGLQSRSRAERNAVGIFTRSSELEERFIEICLKKLKIEPTRLIIEENEDMHHVFFYHSKLGGQLRKISQDCNKIFRLPVPNSRSYVAGMFDASGHVSRTGVHIGGITIHEALMLQQLGVHLKGDEVLNISKFLDLIRGFSIAAAKIHARGVE